MKTLHIEVSGVVQGVYFRAFTKSLATDLGICGVVRNTKRGIVDIIAKGSESQLKQFMEKISKGPPNSRVEGITAQSLPLGNWKGFEIGTSIP